MGAGAGCRPPSADPARVPGAALTSAPQGSGPRYELAAADREYLWDLEHHSNVLVRKGFSQLVRALQQRDESALRKLVSPEFSGTVAASPSEVTFADGSLQAMRQQRTEPTTRPWNADDWVAFLLAERERYPGVPQVKVEVKLIRPEDRQRLDAPWTARCVLRMWGAEEGSRPQETAVMLVMQFERPTKERMEQPGWLLGASLEQVTRSGAGHFIFQDATDRYGIDRKPLYDNWTEEQKLHNTGAVYACDFNRDHCVDLLITDVNMDGNSLLQGLPEGGFRDVTQAMQLTPLRNPLPEIDAAFVDLDGDGWEDLVLCNGDVWRNVEGTRFENVSRRSNLAGILRAAIRDGHDRFSSICVADYDRDGQMDLYLTRNGGRPTSWLEDVKDHPARNLLLHNDGNWRFTDVSEKSGADGGPRSVFTTLWFDANNDRWPDFYVINEFGDGALYVNNADGTFREQDVDPSNDDFGAMGATCGDIDNDGRIDLYVASMYSKAGSRVMGNLPAGIYPELVTQRLHRLISGSEFYQNEGELRFQARGENYQVHDVGWAWGPTMADWNNDGWLDLFATAGYMSRDRSKPDG
jgi:hypothetical protein